MSKIRQHIFILLGFVLVMAGAALHPHVHEDPDILWKIVSQECVLDKVQHSLPAPCVEVEKDYAVLKDRHGKTQYLLIPTTRSPGIEDAKLLDKEAPNYFAAAWKGRRFTEEALKKQLPRQEILLAINSAQGRSQDQLHIHIDCIARDVRSALHAHISEITTAWTVFPIALKGHNYFVRRVDGETLDGVDPFALLAELPDARADMGAETLAVADMVFKDGKPGFVLLADHAHESDHASSEELQDHSCSVAHEFAP